MSHPCIYALIACAGQGARMGQGDALPKQYQRVARQPLVLHTVQAFLNCPEVGGGIVVVAAGDGFWSDEQRQRIAPFVVQAVGGATRALSVQGGLCALLAQGAQAHDWVLVHDAARCLVRPSDISQLIATCRDDEVGGILAWPVVDTLKVGRDRSCRTLDRCDKWQAQTPQMFRIATLLAALERAGPAVGDEASAIEALGLQPKLVAATPLNFKVTYPADHAMVEQLLTARSLALAPSPPGWPRIGEGWDSHVLAAGRPLILGGVRIPYSKGLHGHSDADVLLHAITDALLGASALGDIGRHFANTDARHCNADSRIFLRQTAAWVRERGYSIVNIDATIIAQAPQLAPHMEAICTSIATVLDIARANVNVKAKTAEQLGPVGEGRSMEARAIALLQSSGPAAAHNEPNLR